jgi:hypothetical protein
MAEGVGGDGRGREKGVREGQDGGVGRVWKMVRGREGENGVGRRKRSIYLLSSCPPLRTLWLWQLASLTDWSEWNKTASMMVVH